MLDRLLTLDHLTPEQERHFQKTLYFYYQDLSIKEMIQLHSSLKFHSTEHYLKDHIVHQLVMIQFPHVRIRHLYQIEHVDPTPFYQGLIVKQYMTYLQHKPLTDLYEEWKKTNPPNFNKIHLKMGSHIIFDLLFERVSSGTKRKTKPLNVFLTITGLKFLFPYFTQAE